jgi:hypothetical protein
MAIKRGVKKAGKAKAPPARSAPRPAPSSARRPARQVSARPAPKKSITQSARSHNEPPPVDHNAVLGPLFLAAGHGHLSRLVDKHWAEVLGKYRQAFAAAVAYEQKRSPEMRLAFALVQAPKLKLLLGNLTARVQLLLAQHAREAALRLMHELIETNKLHGQLVSGLFKGVKFAEPSRQGQYGQLLNEYLSSIARVADLERQAKV